MLVYGCCPLEYSGHLHAQEPSGLRSTNEESNKDSGELTGIQLPSNHAALLSALDLSHLNEAAVAHGIGIVPLSVAGFAR